MVTGLETLCKDKQQKTHRLANEAKATQAEADEVLVKLRKARQEQHQILSSQLNDVGVAKVAAMRAE